MIRLKNNNGFTLVELIISMLIMTIIMGLTMTMMISVGNIFTSTADQNINKEIGDGVFNLIENSLKYSSGLEIEDSSSTCTAGYDKAISVDSNGHILYKASAGSNAVSLYNDGFYNGRKIQYTLERVQVTQNNNTFDSPKHIKLTVNVLDKNNNPIYTRSNTIKCINLTLSSKTDIVCSADLSQSNRYISFDCDKLVYEDNNISFNFYNRLVYVKETYNSINDNLANGSIDLPTAQSQINTLFGGYNPTQTKSDISSGLQTSYNKVYAYSNEVLYGVLNKYYNNNGTLYYPSFDKPTSFFQGTYFGNNNKDMAIVAYFQMTPPTDTTGSHIEDFIIYSVERSQLATLVNNYTTHGTTYSQAQIVFNTGKNTWYYQPANANIVTDFFTMLGWYSNAPKTYDITTKSSVVVNQDIDRNMVSQPPKKIWFFTFDGSTSTVWMPLPKSSFTSS